MFARAIDLILTELRGAIRAEDRAAGPDHPQYVVAGNIALEDASNASQQIDDKLVASVINVAEEAAFKNAAHFERRGTSTRYRNAPSFMNLYVLFSANYKDYHLALRRLSQVATFFQGKSKFTLDEPVVAASSDAGPTVEQIEDIRLLVDLYTLSFEQVNHVWATLGGKQMPFLLYKIRFVRIQADRVQGDSPVIEELASDETAV